MSRNKRNAALIIAIIAVNILIAALYTVCVLAEETEIIADISEFRAGIYIDNEKVEYTDNNIYYINKQVDIKLTDKTSETDGSTDNATQEINALLNKLKAENPDEEYELVRDVFLSVSKYEEGDFSEYEDVQGDTYTLYPKDDDVYNRNVLRFKKILSYKIYKVSADEIVHLSEYVYETPVYQFIFDKTSPEITGHRLSEKGEDVQGIESGTGLGNITTGQHVSFKLKDATGLSSVLILRNGMTLDNVNLVGDERIVEYDYELILSKDKESADQIKVVATDLAGNSSEYYFDYTIDNVPPEIEIKGAEDGQVYENVNLTVNASDNCGIVNIYYKCMYTNENGETECLENLTNTESGSITRNYGNQGVYDIIAFAYDQSGNYSQVIRKSFGVDSQAPVLRLENVTENGLYNGNVDIHAVLSELFYDGVNVTMECTVTDDEGARNITLSPYEIGARLNKNIYSFYDEGSYSVKFRASDRNGHESGAELHFTIDRTPPVIEVSAKGQMASEDNMNLVASTNEYEELKDIYNVSPCLRIKAHDTYTEYDTYLNLIRKNKDGSYSEIDNSRIISLGKNTDFTVPVSGEGEYILKIVLKDEAGNISEKNIEFTVDTTPPQVRYLSDINEKYLKSFSLTGKLSDYIEDMTGVKYRAYLNSEEISTCEITKDGKYIIQIVAIDEAGNKSEEAAAFIVDSTQPKVIVSGIDTEGNINLNDSINISLFDSDDYFEKIIVNGKETKLAKDRRSLRINADQYGRYEIEILALDYAGNETRQVIKTNCVYKANPFSVTINSSDIKTLTKNEEEIREKFLWDFSNRKFLVLCISVGCVVLFMAAFLFVDIKILKCDTRR